ncbi:hypothetical protein [Lacipirellula parvula]|nr:hypothetical protein [Lacipirellula parvula]
MPIATWSPGDPVIEFGKISYLLKHRFNFPATTCRIYIASMKAANRYGGVGDRPPRNSETSHDLGLAQVYLELRMKGVIGDAEWVSEGNMKVKSGEKVPDALIRTRDGRATVIEFGGEYSKMKLRDFHLYCEALCLRYEIW